MKFKSDVYGTIAGVSLLQSQHQHRHHIGNLWSASGQRLATVTFSGESDVWMAAGNFGSPVSIQPNTTYVVSYFAPRGHYSQAAELSVSAALATSRRRRGRRRRAPACVANTPSSGNGVYATRAQHIPDEHLRCRELLG